MLQHHRSHAKCSVTDMCSCSRNSCCLPSAAPALQGQQPTVYWTPLGKNTVRMVHTAQLDLPKGGQAWFAVVAATGLRRAAAARCDTPHVLPLFHLDDYCRGSPCRTSAHAMPAHLYAALPAGAKLERDQVPGVKLKTENKKPIVGLAAHPAGTACQCGGSWVALLWAGGVAQHAHSSRHMSPVSCGM